MSAQTFTFRAYAVDESHSWNLPDALAGATPFGVYLICEGEATHLCSLTPSSRADFLYNDFLAPDDEEAAREELERSGDEHENGGEWTTYFDFVRPQFESPYLSEPREIEVEADDDESARDLAWDEARESFSADYPSIPVLMGGEEFRLHLARRALREAQSLERYQGGPPLFAWGGVEAPLSMPQVAA